MENDTSSGALGTDCSNAKMMGSLLAATKASKSGLEPRSASASPTLSASMSTVVRSNGNAVTRNATAALPTSSGATVVVVVVDEVVVVVKPQPTCWYSVPAWPVTSRVCACPNR